MKEVLKVFNELIETTLTNSSNNEAVITNVKLWAESWQREMKEAINYSRCCETLKDKEETAFDLWLKNFEKTEENLYWFDEETLYCIEAMKDIYDTEIKPRL